MEAPQISIHALNGMNTYQTMKITGKFGHHPLHILIDSRSTHNFLDTSTTKKLKCKINRIPPLLMVVANGVQLDCSDVSKGFT